LIHTHSCIERSRPPTSLIGADGNTVVRREHAALLNGLASVCETLLLGFQPHSFDGMVTVCDLDLASQRQDLLWGLVIAKELEFALDFAQIVPGLFKGLSLRYELSLGSVSLRVHRFSPR